jgi:TatA/E family protein of Tat protein translocase
MIGVNGSYPVTAFLGGSPGSGELIVIFLVILVLFGPRRLPEIARMIGKALTSLRRASQDFKDQVLSIDQDETRQPRGSAQQPPEEEYPHHDAREGPDRRTDETGAPARPRG